MSMPWFKHYNNASTSLSIQKTMIELGVIGYAYYFLLLELLCSKFDGSNCVIDLTLSEVAVKLRIKSGRVQVILKSFSESNLVTLESLGVIIRINAPILLELKSKDFARTRHERLSDADTTLLRKRLKNKNKNKNNTIVDSDTYAHVTDTYAQDKQVKNSDDGRTIEEFYLPRSVVVTYQSTMLYPEWVIERTAKEAWPLYIANTNSEKDWPRFLSYYIKKDKENITTLLEDEAAKKRLEEKFKDYV